MLLPSSVQSICSMKEGWKYKKLGDCCEVLNGFAFKSDKYVETGTRVIRITNVQKGYIVDDDPKYYPEHEMSHLGQYCLYENDLLMSLTGNVGRVGLLQKEMLPAALNQRVACLRIKGKEISLRYLFHCLNSVVFEQKAIYSATGIAQKNMSTEWLKKYEIPVPSLSEQESIVAELDCLSSIIEKQKQQLRELDNLAQSIFYTTFGDPISNNFGWENRQWETILKIVNGKNQSKVEDPNGEYPIYGSGGVMGRAKDYLCPANTVIIGRKGNINKPLYVREKMWNVDTAFGLVADNTILHPTYLYYYCIAYDFEQHNKAVTIPSLTKMDLLKINTPVPPIALQQEFAFKIEAIEKQKEIIKQSIEETETLFNSRMDYYFN